MSSSDKENGNRLIMLEKKHKTLENEYDKIRGLYMEIKGDLE